MVASFNQKTKYNKLDDDIDNESGNAKIFPQKLMDILNDPSNEDAIAWHPNGKVFVIVNRQNFSKNVLPKYFRKTKYTSFTRKLNRWNFTRLTRGRQQSTYYHEFFQRGKENLCTQMYCNNDRAKFAISDKASKSSQSSQCSSSLLHDENTDSMSLAEANEKQTQQLIAKSLSSPLHTLPEQHGSMTTDRRSSLPISIGHAQQQNGAMTTDRRSSLPLSIGHAQLLQRDLQARVALLKQQENQLKAELIRNREDKLLRQERQNRQLFLEREQDHLLLKQQEHDRQLLKHYHQKQLSQSIMGNETLNSYNHGPAGSYGRLFDRQQIMEKEAHSLRLQLALMHQRRLPTQSMLNYRASAA